ncbi:hypothetical protein BGX28_003059 [Mortierella sp. GBA30]|nr:hypothetical protein BGX28_003059 [Mortierella sp. GBA30]
MARKNWQRTPLHQLTHTSATNTSSAAATSPAAVDAAPTTAVSRASTDAAPETSRAKSASTVNTNMRTASDSSTASSHIPTVSSSVTTSVASIASIPSITSVASASTVTPSTPPLAKEKTTKPKGLLARLGNASEAKSKDKSTLGPKKPLSSPEKSTASNSVNSTSGNVTTNGNSKESINGAMVLPLLPSLDDFDLSLPFLSESFSSSYLSSAGTATQSLSFSSFTSPSASPSYSNSHPLTTPSLPPPTSQYLTSQSTRVQDYFGPSPSSTMRQGPLPADSTSNRASAMRSKPTTISSTGTIHQHGPTDYSRPLEISDYFKHSNGNSVVSSGLSMKSDLGRVESKNEQDRDKLSKPTGVAVSHSGSDLLSPSRFIIRRPSVSGLSKSSRPTSPSPSVTSAPSEASSLHSKQQQQQRSNLDTPLRQRQMSNASVPEAQSTTAPFATAAARSADTSPRSVPVSTSTSSSPLPKAAIVIAQPERQGTSPATSSSSIGPSPKKVPPLKQSHAGAETSQSPNLRARLSRLFRQSPKQERTPGLDQRYRNQKKQQHRQQLLHPQLQPQQLHQEIQFQSVQHQISAAAAIPQNPPVLILDQEMETGSVKGGIRQV